MTYLYRRRGKEVELDFPMGKAPPKVRHKGNLYYRAYDAGLSIKYRHRAVGDDEDRAFKQSSRVDYDDHARRLEAHHKRQEREAKG